MTSDLVTSRHLSRKAVIYIRPSTPHQVMNNQESQRLQYALRQRAMDLGRSGATVTHREGFKDVIARHAERNRHHPLLRGDTPRSKLFGLVSAARLVWLSRLSHRRPRWSYAGEWVTTEV